MESAIYWWIAVGSITGGASGALVMWNRGRSRTGAGHGRRRLLVFVVGTALAGCQLVAFTQALAPFPPLFGATVVILVTSWIGVVQTVIQLPIPPCLEKVRRMEFDILLNSRAGVRLFGRLLRHTPLRHLGGQVYLAEARGDGTKVLTAIGEAQRVHLWALICSVPWIVSWGMQGNWIAVLAGLAVHLPLNIYPILHLRLAAWRLERHLEMARRGR